MQRLFVGDYSASVTDWCHYGLIRFCSSNTRLSELRSCSLRCNQAVQTDGGEGGRKSEPLRARSDHTPFLCTAHTQADTHTRTQAHTPGNNKTDRRQGETVSESYLQYYTELPECDKTERQRRLVRSLILCSTLDLRGKIRQKVEINAFEIIQFQWHWHWK